MTSSSAPTSIKASVLHGPKSLRIESVPLSPPTDSELQVAIRSTTLCGSDLHYYHLHRNGDIQVTGPVALGHESSGIVVSVGATAYAQGWREGDRVALEVGLPCEACMHCKTGRYNLCSSVRFRSSAKSIPHFWGTLQERINHPAKYCHKLPESIPYSLAALIEPLSVAIHASRRVVRNGTLFAGSTVFVLGAGAVGLLVAAMAKLSGASTIVISDINAGRVSFATTEGFATHGYVIPLDGPKPSTTEEKLAAAKVTALAASDIIDGKEFDVTFECTGTEPCTQAGIYSTRPGGSLVLVGMGHPVQTLPIGAAALREVDILGGFRYANTYPQGIEIVAKNMIPGLDKLVTQQFHGLEKVESAFEMASRQTDDEGKVIIKVECVFDGDDAVAKL